MYMCEEIGLDKADRLELARSMFNKDQYVFDSVSKLDDDELDSYIMVLKHYLDIRKILLLGGKAIEDAKRTLAILEADPAAEV